MGGGRDQSAFTWLWADISENTSRPPFCSPSTKSSASLPWRRGSSLSSRRFRRRYIFRCYSTSTRCPRRAGVQVPWCRLWRRQKRFHSWRIVENIVEIPEIQIVQTSESLFSYTAPDRRLTPAETVEVCRDWSTSACRIRVNHVRHSTRLRA